MNNSIASASTPIPYPTLIGLASLLRQKAGNGCVAILHAGILLCGSAQQSHGHDLPVQCTVGNGACYAALFGDTPGEAVALSDSVGNQTSTPCGVAPVRCTRPFTSTLVSSTSYFTTSTCTGWDYHWSIFQVCPTGYSLVSGVCQPNGDPIPGKNNGDPGPCEGRGNPCNVATGKKYQADTDYVGYGAFPLEFRRYYNSAITTDEGVVKPAHIGTLWRMTYDRSVSYNSGGLIESATVHRPDGRFFYFVEDFGD